jgi:23S rRNA G2069 N7-methylase RlmK/C1962 C5-methylase RlmI
MMYVSANEKAVSLNVHRYSAGRVLNTDHSATYLGFGADNATLNGFDVGGGCTS